MAPRNIINLENVTLNFGKGNVLDQVSIGINQGERIGVVGRNGGGKSSLIRVFSGEQKPDSGRVSITSGARIGALTQVDNFADGLRVRDVVLGDVEEYEWASKSEVREVLTGLFGDFSEATLDREIAPLSGGERRRVALAALLVSDLDLLLLDEPTNHLDVEAVKWLATYLKSRNGLAVIVVTHDRWFLDEVSDRTWEVVRGKVEEYDGGYSAFVLAKAERSRQQNAEDMRRNNLIRKELAWLRRGAPARTTKPKFRVDAANELIATEPPPRDNVELLAFANARLGKTVYELHDADISVGERVLLERINLNFGPGQRIALVGVNGAGKTTLLRTLSGSHKLSAGKLVTGTTVKLAYLSQHLEELNPGLRVLEAVEEIASHIEIGKGKSLSASQLCERLGFSTDAQWTPVGDLSGGERRRLQLTRLLMGGPNVLMLDEPTNDFDVETLAALEDLLDSFAGTLIVVSHDRYFLERVCDDYLALMGDGKLRDLPGGLDQYFELRAALAKSSASSTSSATATVAAPALGNAARRELEKSQQRIERSIAKLDEQMNKLHGQMATESTNYEAIAELNSKLRDLGKQKDELEEQWLEISEQLEG